MAPKEKINFEGIFLKGILETARGKSMNLEKDLLTVGLNRFCVQRGCDLFGVSDLTPARDYLAFQGNPLVMKFPRAISIGMQLNYDIVKQHTPCETRQESLYWYHCYDVVNPMLNFLAYDAARWLTDRNFRALPVPASTPYNMEKLEGIFSHKLAAHLGGVGWIGKSCLLITEKFGPRVRLVSVLTDAPLETGSMLDKKCGSCQACIEACPVGAFTGMEFQATASREARFDARKCSEYRNNHACGRCVSSCPIGIRKL
jgi:epoxyqueuosine reductase QueG